MVFTIGKLYYKINLKPDNNVVRMTDSSVESSGKKSLYFSFKTHKILKWFKFPEFTSYLYIFFHLSAWHTIANVYTSIPFSLKFYFSAIRIWLENNGTTKVALIDFKIKCKSFYIQFTIQKNGNFVFVFLRICNFLVVTIIFLGIDILFLSISH